MFGKMRLSCSLCRIYSNLGLAMNPLVSVSARVIVLVQEHLPMRNLYHSTNQWRNFSQGQTWAFIWLARVAVVKSKCFRVALRIALLVQHVGLERDVSNLNYQIH